jgi:UDP-N-acetylbacillosamine N-acetyltransferase
MTARSIVVFGASGHGKVVADAARSQGFELRAFIDDAPERAGTSFWKVPVLGLAQFLAARAQWPGVQVALGIGSNSARQKCHSRLREAGVPVATVVHASAVIAPTAIVGEGSVIMAGAVVNPDAAVGAGCIVNTGAVVEHDCVLGDFVHLSPNAALGGAVRIGDRTHLGLGAVAIPGTRIGSDVVVGAGAAVIRDSDSSVTLVGVPAKPVQRSKR